MISDRHDYEHPDYLVDTQWLSCHLNDENLRVYDCSVNILPNQDELTNKQIPFVFESNYKKYSQEHIPRSGFIDIPGKFSDQNSTMPLMMPDNATLVELFRESGINNDSRIVLYSTTDPSWAARVWWMMRTVGIDNVAILNGGWKKWVAENSPTSTDTCEYPRGNLMPDYKSSLIASKIDVVNAIADGRTKIICALPPELYSGKSNIIFGRRGRIPTSINVPFGSLHGPDSDSYLPSDELKKRFSDVQVNETDNVIIYCGGGIGACNDAFALSLLGYNNVSVYDGSMIEWGNDNSLPLEVQQ